jgi:CheY-like chemotaxis protein
VLGYHGHELLQADDGEEEGLMMARTLHLEVVVSDIAMPKLWHTPCNDLRVVINMG